MALGAALAAAALSEIASLNRRLQVMATYEIGNGRWVSFPMQRARCEDLMSALLDGSAIDTEAPWGERFKVRSLRCD